ncbi:MAG: hypothetical protein QM771_03355 [Nitrospira sp.]
MPRGITERKGDAMKQVTSLAPVMLLMVLVMAAMGIMVFWGLSLLDLSE